MSQSDRAEGRLRDLREHCLGELRSHTPLTDLLERVDSIDDGADKIVPAFALDIQHRTDGLEPPDAAIAISAITESSNRENHQERKRHVVQADFQVRSQTLRAHAEAWHDDVRDEISAVLTSHHPNWYGMGISQGTPEPLWNDDIGRYQSVTRYDREHWG